MSKQDWIWYGHAGHLIVSASCRFHLLTWVNGYIVSTVGEYFPDREIRRCMKSDDDELRGLKGDDFDHKYFKKYGFEEIGCERKYETMVFIAKKCDCGCDEYKPAYYDCLDFKGYNTSKEASQGHYEFCETWDKAASPWAMKCSPDWHNNIKPIMQLRDSEVIDEWEYEELVKKLEMKLLKGEEE